MSNPQNPYSQPDPFSQPDQARPGQPDLVTGAPLDRVQEVYVVATDQVPVDQQSKTDVAKDQASQVTGTAKEEAGQVAQTAKDEGLAVKDVAVDAGANVVESAKSEISDVATHAGDQLRGLLETARYEARGRAADTHTFVAGNVRGLSGELSAINRGEQTNGPVAQAIGQLAARGEQLSAWLDRSSPDDVVREVRRFAARRPVAFLAIAAGAGLLAGRVARGAKALNDDEQDVRALTTRQTVTRQSVHRDPQYPSQQYTGQQYTGEPHQTGNDPFAPRDTTAGSDADYLQPGQRYADELGYGTGRPIDHTDPGELR